MRLIDADKLIEGRVENDPVRIAVMCTPIAFDVDKVLEQLEKEIGYPSCAECDKHTDCDTCRAEKAIEIVKAGGIKNLDEDMKKEIVNKRIPVNMLVDTGAGPRVVQGDVIVTNDRNGKTISLIYGSRQMTIAFEQVEKYLKD